MPIEAPVELSAWERKEIFKRINYKNVLEATNLDTGENFIKETSYPELITNVNEELHSMGSEDLFRVEVYIDFLYYKVIKSEK